MTRTHALQPSEYPLVFKVLGEAIERLSMIVRGMIDADKRRRRK